MRYSEWSWCVEIVMLYIKDFLMGICLEILSAFKCLRMFLRQVTDFQQYGIIFVVSETLKKNIISMKELNWWMSFVVAFCLAINDFYHSIHDSMQI